MWSLPLGLYGLVTALKEGTATITATSVATDADGNHATASCEITVKGLTSVSFKVNGQMEDLSCGKIGVLPGVSAVSGLYVADEQRREVDAEQTLPGGHRESTCSSPGSFARAPAEADNGEDICLIGKRQTAVPTPQRLQPSLPRARAVRPFPWKSPPEMPTALQSQLPTV
ncbi:MAG: Ig domain-containing protein [Oscillospiraceae bacterium]